MAKDLFAIKTASGVSWPSTLQLLSVRRAFHRRASVLIRGLVIVTTDAKILYALRASPDGVSGTQLAEQLAISRAAIWSRMEELRKVGFAIEAGPHFGYRLVDEPDALLADDLIARLGETKVIGRDIQVFEQTTSTNDVAEKLARDGVKEGAVVFAESQTKGRGRLGRAWLSPTRKGLWSTQWW